MTNSLVDSAPAVLGVREMTDLLGIPESTVRRLCREGTIPALHLGRRWVISRTAFEQLIGGCDGAQNTARARTAATR